ncbi:MAG: carbonic anhydrase [Bacteroidia bacterium]|nr:carbonic anhydrase [Bacteroidia bacterium]
MNIDELLKANQRWIKGKLIGDEEFFKKQADSLHPQLMWIICSDSVMRANEVTQTKDSENLVHRNMGNLVVPTDENLLSVVHYAVNVLEIEHIIICGHYGCKGVSASLNHQDVSYLDHWLKNIKEVYVNALTDLEKIEDVDKRMEKLVELNVMESVNNLSNISVIQNKWKNRQTPFIHGWTFRPTNGQLMDLEISKSGKEAPITEE